MCLVHIIMCRKNALSDSGKWWIIITLQFTEVLSFLVMSHAIRKPMFCIWKNKDADQLRGSLAADQHLCFCYIDKKKVQLHFLPNSKINFEPLAVFFGRDSCQTWSKILKTGYLMTRLTYLCVEVLSRAISDTSSWVSLLLRSSVLDSVVSPRPSSLLLLSSSRTITLGGFVWKAISQNEGGARWPSGRAKDYGARGWGSILTLCTVLCPWARHIFSLKVRVIPRKRWLGTDMTENCSLGYKQEWNKMHLNENNTV